MSKHLEKDLERLKKEILAMGSLVEEVLTTSLKAFFERNAALAKSIVDKDDLIDQKENEIEEECLKLLALHQPVAGDLRYIITALKVNNDLERMSDYCVNVAERAIQLAGTKPLPLPENYLKGIEITQTMVRRSLDALVRLDVDLAREVREEDDKVDAIHKEMFQIFQEKMKKDPAIIDQAMATLSVFRYMERVADLATNIAEDVVFMVEGEIVRHSEGLTYCHCARGGRHCER
ncbi:MAG: phosphate signaling complex protein PhoU [Deltaproteobacteria bacterium]|nr:phosphate signaling complex protein PhoU [Deltaproteobacteria bacterium]